MRKVGRFTAALLLIGVGAAVIADQYLGTHGTKLLIQWWPILFISLGLEYMGFHMKYGESDKVLKLDLGGVIFAVLISAVVIGSTHSEALLRGGWWTIAEGQPRDNGTTSFVIPSGTDRIAVANPYGNVIVRSGNTSSDQLQIQTTVYVPVDDSEAADAIIKQSRLESANNNNTLNIVAKGKEYGGFWGKQETRMDMVITVPERTQGSISLDLDLSNGSITVENLSLKKQLKAKTTNGAIQITSVEADIEMKSTNAKITASQTKGNMKLHTTNGSIEAKDHVGDIRLESTNGDLKTAGVTGAIVADTTNGKIQLGNAASSVKAKTTNGAIEAVSKSVNGDWDLQTTHGKIEVGLPSTGDFQVRAKGQDLYNKSSLPLHSDRREMDGKVGTGKHSIHLKTNGSLTIRNSE